MNDPLEPADQDDYFHVLIKTVLSAKEAVPEDRLLAGVGRDWCRQTVADAVAAMEPADVIEITVRRGYA